LKINGIECSLLQCSVLTAELISMSSNNLISLVKWEVYEVIFNSTLKLY